MSRIIAACALSIVSSLARADEKPNTLTAREIEEGWVLLFDGETTFGWTAEAGEAGQKPELAAKNGSMLIRGNPGRAQVSSPFHHFELKGEYRTASAGPQLTVNLRSPGVGLELGDGLQRSEKEWRSLVVRISPREMFVNAGEPGKTGLTGPNLAPDAAATIGFRLSGNESTIELRNLKLRPLGIRDLLTGKNLDGWKVNQADPKRMASRFEVTKDGELSVKSGPGDLVTEKEFDNFILQFECKTLGKGLNSGIFFRCIPGQHQIGYEAQIQNLFKGDDRTKPVDFGTGAIYRRIPARKVVSNDNEWFTMTVAASGKHIATWVNGYQTVDWTDERPADDNPRKGYRARKGPISIQGHDPTTELLFRNIRIAEIPAAKKD